MDQMSQHALEYSRKSVSESPLGLSLTFGALEYFEEFFFLFRKNINFERK